MITLLTYPPTGSGYLVGRDDWIRNLLIHELVHIVHLDMTEGFPDIVRTIFGSIGKFGGIVPVWFSEGLATWAETAFTSGGRGRSRLLRYETDRKLLDGDFCRTIDCLDSPGVYPRGSTAYWVGWRFLSFLEERKEGTLRCLVKTNSGKVPFFFYQAFHECTGRSAPENFADFLSSLRRHYAGEWRAPPLFEAVELPDGGEGIEFQRGMVVDGNRAYYADDDDGRSFLNEFDLGSLGHSRVRVEENVHALLGQGRGGILFSVTRHAPSSNAAISGSSRGRGCNLATLARCSTMSLISGGKRTISPTGTTVGASISKDAIRPWSSSKSLKTSSRPLSPVGRSSLNRYL